MKKTASLTIATAMILAASVGFAAPLTDYSAGKTAIDLTFRNSDVNDKGPGYDVSFDKSNNLDWGITTGLGNHFALQYNGYNANTKDTSIAQFGIIGKGELKTQEFNVVYQLDEHVSAYTGMVKSKWDISDNVSGSSSTDSKSKLQFGLVGSTKIADKTTAYASFAMASDFTNWKIGLAQEIAPNLDLNVDYRRLQVKNLTGNDFTDKVDITAKGLGFGVTYKF